MTNKAIHRFLTFGISLVWIANGLFCKVLNLVPRHQQIVARILGAEYSRHLTFAIGCAEILMAIWILSNIKTRLNAVVQIAIVMTMNIIEITLAPDLLLWGRVNLLFALLFVLVVYINEYYLRKE